MNKRQLPELSSLQKISPFFSHSQNNRFFKKYVEITEGKYHFLIIVSSTITCRCTGNTLFSEFIFSQGKGGTPFGLIHESLFFVTFCRNYQRTNHGFFWFITTTVEINGIFKPFSSANGIQMAILGFHVTSPKIKLRNYRFF